MERGCHVFIEKPLADTVEGAQRVAEVARRTGRKLVIGYILRYHPSWQRFVAFSGPLGKLLVMRKNINQKSHGRRWRSAEHTSDIHSIMRISHNVLCLET